MSAHSAAASAADYYRPTPFEVATSWLHGLAPASPVITGVGHPRAELESIVAEAMGHQPTFVTFSGGRDSSAILAVATHVARREGLALPVPVTEFYPGLPEADEECWQRMVLDHLGLTRWERISIRGDSDLVGERSSNGLLQRGLVWPPALQTKTRLFGQLRGGAVLTGEGGDEVLGARRIRPVQVCARTRQHSSRAQLGACMIALVPRPARTALLRHQMSHGDDVRPWLRPAAARQSLAMIARDEAREPLRWDRSLMWVPRRRPSVMLRHNHALMAAEFDVRPHDPLLDPRFVSALGALGGRRGLGSRTDIMRLLFADLLPAPVIERTSKASFNRAYKGEATREFARAWTGAGVDHELVDADRLKEEWLSSQPSGMSATLLQQAWLARQPARPNRLSA